MLLLTQLSGGNGVLAAVAGLPSGVIEVCGT